MLRRLVSRCAGLLRRRPLTRVEIDAAQVEKLRRRGVRIGDGCRIYTAEFSTEPWLVKIGNRVGIAGGVKFLTHDGSAFLIRNVRPRAQRLGTIVVGDDVFIGENAILLPGTVIGDGSIIGPAAVVRGTIAPNSFVFGNPAQTVGRASLFLERMKIHADTVDSYGLDEAERRRMIEAHFKMES